MLLGIIILSLSMVGIPIDCLETPTETYNIDFSYYKHDNMTKFLQKTALLFPNITSLYSIGKSVQGRDLWVMAISSTPHKHVLGKPEVKYIGNIHGNEPVGGQLLLHLIHSLVTQYGSNETITWLLDNTRIHILPSMNPDGFEIAKEGMCISSEENSGRTNAKGFDLNRNFPDAFDELNKSFTPQPESKAIIEWLKSEKFILSGCMHGGAVVANYPLDASPVFDITQWGKPAYAPDDDVLSHMALIYSRSHHSMHLGTSCNEKFSNGITNGNAWYPVFGGMQDYNYVLEGCMEITFELSCCKYPEASELPSFWQQNYQALINYIGQVHQGVKGFVFAENGTPIQNALLRIAGRDIGFQTSQYGEFWRILLPGNYTLSVNASGYDISNVNFEVIKNHLPTILNITMHALSKFSS